LAKEAACDGELDITYNKYPKSAVKRDLREQGLQKWQREWDISNKGTLTKSFFPNVKDRLVKKLKININMSTVVAGHGKSKVISTKIQDNRRPDVPMCNELSNHRTFKT
jgi:hypothetical protein